MPQDPPATGTGPAESEGQHAESAQIVRSAGLVGVITLLSRLTGLLRESLQARYLGTRLPADAFRVAFLLPNLMRRLVGEGAIASAFVPAYTQRLAREGEAEGRTFAEKFLVLWLLVVVVLTLVGIALAGWIVTWGFGYGEFDDPTKLELTTGLTRLLFWYLILIGAVAAIQGILNARGIFGMPAFAPVAFNLAFAALAWFLVERLGPGKQAHAVALAVLGAGVVQLLILLPQLAGLGIRLRLTNPFNHPGVREVMRLLVPGTVGAGIYQINVAVSTSIATSLAEGAAASLNYSNRLMEFVLGIFVFALSTVSLTSLARYAAAGDQESFDRTVAQVLRLSAFITIPSTVGLYVLRRPVLSLLFEGGEFDATSLVLTQEAFRAHVVGMLFVGWNRVLVACFHSMKDLKTPVAHGAVNLVIHLTLAWFLSRQLGHAGIALAASLASACQCAGLLGALVRCRRGLRLPGLATTTAKTLAAAAAMGLVCERAWSLCAPSAPGKLALGLSLGVVIALGIAVFFALAWALRLGEVEQLAGALRRKVRVGGAGRG